MRDKYMGGLYDGDGDTHGSYRSRWQYVERWCKAENDLKTVLRKG